MTVTLALAGDTMLGRGVADRINRDGPYAVVSERVRDITADADLFVLNLECCISDRGERWDDPAKPFFFRAPPSAVETLRWLGVDAVTLANNHALDYGATALLDTRTHLESGGIVAVGAGATRDEARATTTVAAHGLRVGILGVTDHPADYAATVDTPGVAYADLGTAVPEWLTGAVRRLRAESDVALVMPHWGPNMTPAPVPHVRDAALALRDAGATLVAGHSAHVFHGAREGICYDLGDFVDDYAVHPYLRNDLGLVFLVTIDATGPVRLTAVPLALEFCYTRPAVGEEYVWVRDRFADTCRALGSDVRDEGDRLAVHWR